MVRTIELVELRQEVQAEEKQLKEGKKEELERAGEIDQEIKARAKRFGLLEVVGLIVLILNGIYLSKQLKII